MVLVLAFNAFLGPLLVNKSLVLVLAFSSHFLNIQSLVLFLVWPFKVLSLLRLNLSKSLDS